MSGAITVGTRSYNPESRHEEVSYLNLSGKETSSWISPDLSNALTITLDLNICKPPAEMTPAGQEPRMVAQQWLQGRELLGPLAPYLLQQGLWHRRTGSTTSTKEQLRKEEKKTHQQFKKHSTTLHKLLGWKMRNRLQQLAEDFYGVRTELSKLGHGQGTGPTSLSCNRTPCPQTPNALVLHLLQQTAQGPVGLPLLCAGQTSPMSATNFL